MNGLNILNFRRIEGPQIYNLRSLRTKNEIFTPILKLPPVPSIFHHSPSSFNLAITPQIFRFQKLNSYLHDLEWHCLHLPGWIFLQRKYLQGFYIYKISNNISLEPRSKFIFILDILKLILWFNVNKFFS